MKHGRGVYQYADGGRFEGEFSNGARNGIGVRIWPHGRVKVRARCHGAATAIPQQSQMSESSLFLQFCNAWVYRLFRQDAVQ